MGWELIARSRHTLGRELPTLRKCDGGRAQSLVSERLPSAHSAGGLFRVTLGECQRMQMRLKRI